MSTAALISLVAMAVVVVGSAVVNFFGAPAARSTSDFLVAGRSVGPVANAAAISGEYLSAAALLGIAGLVVRDGADALWYPIGFTAGYLALLLFVAAPLRRSGAYTVSDFADARLGHPGLRRVCTVFTVIVGWLGMVPQLQGSGLTIATVTPLPPWVGSVAAAVVIMATMLFGGLRSMTLVQAVQFFVKVVALAVPTIALMVLFLHEPGQHAPAEHAWLAPLTHAGPHSLLWTYSLLTALFLGTLGLPSVLARFYTNRDGRAARRTAVAALGLVGGFYVLPVALGALARFALPQLAHADPDATVLLIPAAAFDGLGADLLTGLVAAGAWAAFLSAGTGLAVSVAGAVHTELLRRTRTSGFRIAAIVVTAVPLLLTLVLPPMELAEMVALAFAVAASTLCPLLVLGIWWRGLTATGAIAGMLVGGVSAMCAVVATLLGVHAPGVLGVLLRAPAAVTAPAAFVVMIVVSALTAQARPAEAEQVMLRLHAPERLGLGEGRERQADGGAA